MSIDFKHLIGGIIGATLMIVANHFSVSSQIDTHVNNSVQQIATIVSDAVSQAYIK